MKVLKNNFNKTSLQTEVKTYPRKLICEECGSELEYEKSDIEMGVLGCMHLKCPLCGFYNMLEEHESNINLTEDNIEFPTHFFHTSKETGAVDICNNEEVKRYIKRGINYLRENKEEEYAWHSGSGNLFVYIHRFEGDDEYFVMVSKDYYETYIPLKPEDYNN